MRLAVPLSLVLLAAATRLAAGPVPKAAKATTWYPTAVGTKWVYQQGNREWTEEITAAVAKGGMTTLSVPRTEGGGAAEDNTFAVTAAGLTKLTAGRFRIDNLLVRFPPKAGDGWPVDTPVQDGLLCEGGDCTVGAAEEVAVPAGKYKAFPVRFVATKVDGQVLPQPGRACTYWYAEGVGLVKFHAAARDATDTETVRELKSFTPVQPAAAKK